MALATILRKFALIVSALTVMPFLLLADLLVIIIEEVTNLTLLESATENFEILDQNGLSRFKSGFVIDNKCSAFIW